MLCMLQYMYNFLEALIVRQTAPEDAYKKLDDMAAQLTDSLRQITKRVFHALNQRRSNPILSLFSLPLSVDLMSQLLKPE